MLRRWQSCQELGEECVKQKSSKCRNLPLGVSAVCVSDKKKTSVVELQQVAGRVLGLHVRNRYVGSFRALKIIIQEILNFVVSVIGKHKEILMVNM